MLVIRDISSEGVNVGSVLQGGIFCYLLVRGELVANESNDNVLGLAGKLTEKFIL